MYVHTKTCSRKIYLSVPNAGETNTLSIDAGSVLGTSDELFMHPLPWVCLENTTLGWKEPIAKEKTL